MDYDLIIRGGTIADGTGGPFFEGDLAVKDGRIIDIGGKIFGQGKEEVDARGKLVTPGFVDIHTHYDGQATWEERLIPSSWHGVTTTMFGNCGVGFAPVRASDRDDLIDLMEGVEDIPGTALHEGLKWDWETFPEFLDALDRRRHDIDICTQIPHAALRVYVMGKRALNLEPATETDIAEMRRLVTDGVRAGALGVTTSRSFNHVNSKGDPTPTLRAEERELVGLAMGLKDAGRGVIELTANFGPKNRERDLAMLRRIMKTSGRPLSITISQQHSDPEGWRDMLNGLDAAALEGLEMRAQIAPRSIGSMFGLRLSRHQFSFHPSFKAIAGKPLAEKVSIMRDPSFRARVLTEGAEHHTARLIQRAANFKYTFRLGKPANYEPTEDQSVAAIAAREGRSGAEVSYDLLMEDEGKALMFAPNNNYAAYNLDAVHDLIKHPRTCLGLSDGGAHVGYITDSGFPTFALTFWGRDRKHGRIDLPWLIYWITGATADLAGLNDRGRLKRGLRADINVIDYDRLKLTYPYLSYDLPLGGMRFMQKAEGYVATFLGGVATYREGEPTGALPGRLVRAQPLAAVR